MWAEKYRPKDYSDIIGQDNIVAKVKGLVESGDMPHLLFSGPAGVGKTSLALVIARNLYGEDFGNNFLEMNASDERGIDIVRNRIKDFARTKSVKDVPFRIVYLDECDSLTKDAQHALRRTMENYTTTCRFILSCNYSSKIIEPIQSRCAVFRFKPLEDKDLKEILRKIVKNEKLKASEDSLNALCEISSGDARKAQNLIQSCAAISDKISESTIYDVTSFAEPREIDELLKLSIGGEFVKAKDILLRIMFRYGLSGLDVIKQIQKEILKLKMENKKKMEMIEKCGEIEFRMVEGSDEFIQLESLLASFSK